MPVLTGVPVRASGRFDTVKRPLARISVAVTAGKRTVRPLRCPDVRTCAAHVGLIKLICNAGLNSETLLAQVQEIKPGYGARHGAEIPHYNGAHHSVVVVS